MIVDEPRITVAGDEVVVTAPVTLETALRPREDGGTPPPTLYFAFPRAYEQLVTDRADAFAAGLLPLAMRRRERLRLRGGLSSRLAAGMRDYARLQAAWKPDFFSPVEVEFDRLVSAPPAGGAGAVGSAFSGGVDSFHTLWAHLAANETYGPSAITHCLMINGFDEDSDLDGTGRFRALQAVYEPMLAGLGIPLVVARTNLRRFLDDRILKQSFAAFVVAPALALGQQFSRFYVPSSYRFTALGRLQDGSHPMLDHLLSTGTTEVIHDGGHLTRLEKTFALSRWPATFDRLRVCFRPTRVEPGTGVIANCCACEKCVRTMVTLELAGALADFRCFPQPLARRRIRSLDYRWYGSRIFAYDIIRHARSAGRRDLARDLRRAVFASLTVRSWLTPLVAASYAAERRSKRYADLLRLPKRVLKRLGIGRGWLYY